MINTLYSDLTSLGYNRGYVLLFDHRQSNVTGMFHFKSPLTAEQDAAAAESKQGLTILSGIAFRGLKSDDGDAVSQHKAILPAE